MKRRSKNAKKTFKETVEANSKEVQASLSNRRVEMDSSWDALDDEWKELERQMASIGITELESPDNDLLSLNVGGLHLNVRPTVLQSLHPKQSNTTPWTLADLFKCVWDSRVPRDKDGRIFLDESPTIMKYLVHSTIKASKTRVDVTFPYATNTLATDQQSYLHLFSEIFMGLRNTPLNSHGMLTMGESELMTKDELKQLSVLLRESLPGDPQCLELIYQGSCDGLQANAFHEHCTDESPSTLTLIKVKHDGIGTGSSVVGGFTSTSWSVKGADNYPRKYRSEQLHFNSRRINNRLVNDRSEQFYCNKTGAYINYATKDSPGAFNFMAIDGQASRNNDIQLVKIELPRGSRGHAVIRCGSALGPDFGEGGFRVAFAQSKAQFILGDSANITGTEASQLRNLSGKQISELEVYRVSNSPVTPTNKDKSEKGKGERDKVDSEQVENLRLFGTLIAGSLMEERVALLDAQAELVRARERKEAAASALVAVYGPDIASGKSDPVVELSIRGTRMTTLRSTLQACPESALAARFDESKWPVDGKDFGVIDCSPSSFSKVLDVLRLRKRAKWSPSTLIKTIPRVEIPEVDRVCFEEFVGMYFPGCENFITDWVTFRKSLP